VSSGSPSPEQTDTAVRRVNQLLSYLQSKGYNSFVNNFVATGTAPAWLPAACHSLQAAALLLSPAQYTGCSGWSALNGSFPSLLRAPVGRPFRWSTSGMPQPSIFLGL